MLTLLKKLVLLFTIAVVSLGLTSEMSYSADVGGIALFGGGIVTGIYFHEAGHATVAIMNGCSVDEIGFQYTNVRCPDPSSEKNRQISLGGYAFQGMASEVIIQNKDWHQNDFALGWMFMGIYNNLSNPIRYYVFDQIDNDLGGYAKAGGNPAIPSVLMVAHSIYSFYRIFHDPDIVPQMEKTFLGRHPQSNQVGKPISKAWQVKPYLGKNSAGLVMTF